MRNSHKHSSSLKFISGLTLILFLTTQGVCPPGYASVRPAKNKSNQMIEAALRTLPKNLGSISDARIDSQSKSPFVLIVQDAHGQVEAQTNTERLLDYLDQKISLDAFFIEGGAGKLNPEKLRLFREPSMNLAAAKWFLKEGDLGGAELFLLKKAGVTAKQNKRKKLFVMGLEDQKLYLENLSLFEKIAAQKTVTEGWLSQRLLYLEKKASQVFNPELLRFFKAWCAFEEMPNHFERYLAVLEQAAVKKVRIQLSDAASQHNWPMLVRLSELKRRQARLNYEEASGDALRLMEWAQSKGIGGALFLSHLKNLTNTNKSASLDDLRSQWESFYVIAKSFGFDFEQYPALTLWEGARILEAEMDANQLMAEANRLRDLILEKLALKPEEKAIMKAYRDYLRLQKLFQLRLDRTEFEEIAKSDADVLLNETDLSDASEIEDVFSNAIQFYKMAIAREKPMAEFLFQQRQEHGVKVFVSGGFHTPAITQQLREEGYSYAVISPRMSRVEDEVRYWNSIVSNKPLFAPPSLKSVELGTALSVSYIRAANLLAEWRGQLPREMSKRRMRMLSGIRQAGYRVGAEWVGQEKLKVGRDPLSSSSLELSGSAFLRSEVRVEAGKLEKPEIVTLILEKDQKIEDRLNALAREPVGRPFALRMVPESNAQKQELLSLDFVLLEALPDWKQNMMDALKSGNVESLTQNGFGLTILLKMPSVILETEPISTVYLQFTAGRSFPRMSNGFQGFVNDIKKRTDPNAIQSFRAGLDSMEMNIYGLPDAGRVDAIADFFSLLRDKFLDEKAYAEAKDAYAKQLSTEATAETLTTQTTEKPVAELVEKMVEGEGAAVEEVSETKTPVLPAPAGVVSVSELPIEVPVETPAAREIPAVPEAATKANNQVKDTLRRKASEFFNMPRTAQQMLDAVKIPAGSLLVGPLNHIYFQPFEAVPLKASAKKPQESQPVVESSDTVIPLYFSNTGNFSLEQLQYLLQTQMVSGDQQGQVSERLFGTVDPAGLLRVYQLKAMPEQTVLPDDSKGFFQKMKTQTFVQAVRGKIFGGEFDITKSTIQNAGLRKKQAHQWTAWLEQVTSEFSDERLSAEVMAVIRNNFSTQIRRFEAMAFLDPGNQSIAIAQIQALAGSNPSALKNIERQQSKAYNAKSKKFNEDLDAMDKSFRPLVEKTALFASELLASFIQEEFFEHSKIEELSTAVPALKPQEILTVSAESPQPVAAALAPEKLEDAAAERLQQMKRETAQKKGQWPVEDDEAFRQFFLAWAPEKFSQTKKIPNFPETRNAWQAIRKKDMDEKAAADLAVQAAETERARVQAELEAQQRETELALQRKQTERADARSAIGNFIWNAVEENQKQGNLRWTKLGDESGIRDYARTIWISEPMIDQYLASPEAERVYPDPKEFRKAMTAYRTEKSPQALLAGQADELRTKLQSADGNDLTAIQTLLTETDELLKQDLLVKTQRQSLESEKLGMLKRAVEKTQLAVTAAIHGMMELKNRLNDAERQNLHDRLLQTITLTQSTEIADSQRELETDYDRFELAFVAFDEFQTLSSFAENGIYDSLENVRDVLLSSTSLREKLKTAGENSWLESLDELRIVLVDGYTVTLVTAAQAALEGKEGSEIPKLLAAQTMLTQADAVLFADAAKFLDEEMKAIQSKLQKRTAAAAKTAQQEAIGDKVARRQEIEALLKTAKPDATTAASFLAAPELKAELTDRILVEWLTALSQEATGAEIPGELPKTGKVISYLSSALQKQATADLKRQLFAAILNMAKARSETRTGPEELEADREIGRLRTVEMLGVSTQIPRGLFVREGEQDGFIPEQTLPLGLEEYTLERPGSMEAYRIAGEVEVKGDRLPAYAMDYSPSPVWQELAALADPENTLVDITITGLAVKTSEETGQKHVNGFYADYKGQSGFVPFSAKPAYLNFGVSDLEKSQALVGRSFKAVFKNFGSGGDSPIFYISEPPMAEDIRTIETAAPGTVFEVFVTGIIYPNNDSAYEPSGLSAEWNGVRLFIPGYLVPRAWKKDLPNKIGEVVSAYAHNSSDRVYSLIASGENAAAGLRDFPFLRMGQSEMLHVKWLTHKRRADGSYEVTGLRVTWNEGAYEGYVPLDQIPLSRSKDFSEDYLKRLVGHDFVGNFLRLMGGRPGFTLEPPPSVTVAMARFRGDLMLRAAETYAREVMERSNGSDSTAVKRGDSFVVLDRRVQESMDVLEKTGKADFLDSSRRLLSQGIGAASHPEIIKILTGYRERIDAMVQILHYDRAFLENLKSESPLEMKTGQKGQLQFMLGGKSVEIAIIAGDLVPEANGDMKIHLAFDTAAPLIINPRKDWLSGEKYFVLDSGQVNHSALLQEHERKKTGAGYHTGIRVYSGQKVIVHDVDSGDEMVLSVLAIQGDGKILFGISQNDFITREVRFTAVRSEVRQPKQAAAAVKDRTLHVGVSPDMSYEVKMSDNLFSPDNPLLNQEIKNRKVLVVADINIGKAKLKEIRDYLKHFGITFKVMTLSGGEQVKDGEEGLSNVIKIMKNAEDAGLSRKDLMILIGGGAVLDVGGFAASIAHRGIPHVRIPTTLLAQVDAGIGVKNSINFFGQKNFVGAFRPPQSVLVDPAFLNALHPRQMRSGMAEAIKVSLMKDADYFRLIEAHGADLLNLDFSAQSRARDIMWLSIVRHLEQIHTDPFETKLARPLDYGHEWGHRLESVTNHAITHGEGVAIGTAIDTVISWQRGYISRKQLERVLKVLEQSGLPVYHMDATVNNLWPGLESFRRHLGGKLTISLLGQIGRKRDTHRMDKRELRDALGFLRHRAARSEVRMEVWHAALAVSFLVPVILRVSRKLHERKENQLFERYPNTANGLKRKLMEAVRKDPAFQGNSIRKIDWLKIPVETLQELETLFSGNSPWEIQLRHSSYGAVLFFDENAFTYALNQRVYEAQTLNQKKFVRTAALSVHQLSTRSEVRSNPSGKRKQQKRQAAKKEAEEEAELKKKAAIYVIALAMGGGLLIDWAFLGLSPLDPEVPLGKFFVTYFLTAAGIALAALLPQSIPFWVAQWRAGKEQWARKMKLREERAERRRQLAEERRQAQEREKILKARAAEAILAVPQELEPVRDEAVPQAVKTPFETAVSLMEIKIRTQLQAFVTIARRKKASRNVESVLIDFNTAVEEALKQTLQESKLDAADEAGFRRQFEGALQKLRQSIESWAAELKTKETSVYTAQRDRETSRFLNALVPHVESAHSFARNLMAQDTGRLFPYEDALEYFDRHTAVEKERLGTRIKLTPEDVRILDGQAEEIKKGLRQKLDTDKQAVEAARETKRLLQEVETARLQAFQDAKMAMVDYLWNRIVTKGHTAKFGIEEDVRNFAQSWFTDEKVESYQEDSRAFIAKFRFVDFKNAWEAHVKAKDPQYQLEQRVRLALNILGQAEPDQTEQVIVALHEAASILKTETTLEPSQIKRLRGAVEKTLSASIDSIVRVLKPALNSGERVSDGIFERLLRLADLFEELQAEDWNALHGYEDRVRNLKIQISDHRETFELSMSAERELQDLKAAVVLNPDEIVKVLRQSGELQQNPKLPEVFEARIGAERGTLFDRWVDSMEKQIQAAIKQLEREEREPSDLSELDSVAIAVTFEEFYQKTELLKNAVEVMRRTADVAVWLKSLDALVQTIDEEDLAAVQEALQQSAELSDISEFLRSKVDERLEKLVSVFSGKLEELALTVKAGEEEALADAIHSTLTALGAYLQDRTLVWMKGARDAESLLRETAIERKKSVAAKKVADEADAIEKKRGLLAGWLKNPVPVIEAAQFFLDEPSLKELISRESTIRKFLEQAAKGNASQRLDSLQTYLGIDSKGTKIVTNAPSDKVFGQDRIFIETLGKMATALRSEVRAKNLTLKGLQKIVRDLGYGESLYVGELSGEFAVSPVDEQHLHDIDHKLSSVEHVVLRDYPASKIVWIDDRRTGDREDVRIEIKSNSTRRSEIRENVFFEHQPVSLETKALYRSLLPGLPELVTWHNAPLPLYGALPEGLPEGAHVFVFRNDGVLMLRWIEGGEVSQQAALLRMMFTPELNQLSIEPGMLDPSYFQAELSAYGSFASPVFALWLDRYLVPFAKKLDVGSLRFMNASASASDLATLGFVEGGAHVWLRALSEVRLPLTEATTRLSLPPARAEMRSLPDDWESLTASDLFSPEERVIFDWRMSYLDGLWPRWDEPAKQMLLTPSFLLMLLGAKPGYISTTSAESLPAKFFGVANERFRNDLGYGLFNDDLQSPIAFSLKESIQSVYENEVHYREQGLPLSNEDILGLAVLSKHPYWNWQDEHILFARKILSDLFADAVKQDRTWDIFMGLIAGYPAEDVKEYVRLNGRELGHQGVLENFMDYRHTEFANVFFLSRKEGSPEADRQKARFRAALYYAYAGLRHHPDFTKIAGQINLPERVHTASVPASLARSEVRVPSPDQADAKFKRWVVSARLLIRNHGTYILQLPSTSALNTPERMKAGKLFLELSQVLGRMRIVPIPAGGKAGLSADFKNPTIYAHGPEDRGTYSLETVARSFIRSALTYREFKKIPDFEKLADNEKKMKTTQFAIEADMAVAQVRKKVGGTDRDFALLEDLIDEQVMGLLDPDGSMFAAAKARQGDIDAAGLAEYQAAIRSGSLQPALPQSMKVYFALLQMDFSEHRDLEKLGQSTSGFELELTEALNTQVLPDQKDPVPELLAGLVNAMSSLIRKEKVPPAESMQILMDQQLVRLLARQVIEAMRIYILAQYWQGDDLFELQRRLAETFLRVDPSLEFYSFLRHDFLLEEISAGIKAADISVEAAERLQGEIQAGKRGTVSALGTAMAQALRLTSEAAATSRTLRLGGGQTLRISGPAGSETPAVSGATAEKSAADQTGQDSSSTTASARTGTRVLDLTKRPLFPDNAGYSLSGQVLMTNMEKLLNAMAETKDPVTAEYFVVNYPSDWTANLETAFRRLEANTVSDLEELKNVIIFMMHLYHFEISQGAVLKKKTKTLETKWAAAGNKIGGVFSDAELDRLVAQLGTQKRVGGKKGGVYTKEQIRVASFLALGLITHLTRLQKRDETEMKMGDEQLAPKARANYTKALGELAQETGDNFFAYVVANLQVVEQVMKQQKVTPAAPSKSTADSERIPLGSDASAVTGKASAPAETAPKKKSLWTVMGDAVTGRKEEKAAAPVEAAKPTYSTEPTFEGFLMRVQGIAKTVRAHVERKTLNEAVKAVKILFGGSESEDDFKKGYKAIQRETHSDLFQGREEINKASSEIFSMIHGGTVVQKDLLAALDRLIESAVTYLKGLSAEERAQVAAKAPAPKIAAPAGSEAAVHSSRLESLLEQILAEVKRGNGLLEQLVNASGQTPVAGPAGAAASTVAADESTQTTVPEKVDPLRKDIENLIGRLISLRRDFEMLQSKYEELKAEKSIYDVAVGMTITGTDKAPELESILSRLPGWLHETLTMEAYGQLERFDESAEILKEKYDSFNRALGEAELALPVFKQLIENLEAAWPLATTMAFAKSEVRRLPSQPVRSEVRTRDAGQVESVVAVARQMTAKIVRIADLRPEILEKLFPLVLRQPEVQLPDTERQWILRFYTALFKQGGSIILPAALLRQTSTEARRDYIRLLIEALQNARVNPREPLINIADDQNNELKNLFFSPENWRVNSAVGVDASRAVKFWRETEGFVAARLEKQKTRFAAAVTKPTALRSRAFLVKPAEVRKLTRIQRVIFQARLTQLLQAASALNEEEFAQLSRELGLQYQMGEAIALSPSAILSSVFAERMNAVLIAKSA